MSLGFKPPSPVLSTRLIVSSLLAVKSGVGLAPLPVPFAEQESDLVAVLGPLPELTYPFYLVMHRDMRRTPRVRAFFDFVIAEIKTVRLALSGVAQRPKQ